MPACLGALASLQAEKPPRPSPNTTTTALPCEVERVFAPLTRDQPLNSVDSDAKEKNKKENRNSGVAFGCFYSPDEVFDTAAASNIYGAAAVQAEGVAADSCCHSRQEHPGGSFASV